MAAINTCVLLYAVQFYSHAGYRAIATLRLNADVLTNSPIVQHILNNCVRIKITGKFLENKEIKES